MKFILNDEFKEKLKLVKPASISYIYRDNDIILDGIYFIYEKFTKGSIRKDTVLARDTKPDISGIVLSIANYNDNLISQFSFGTKSSCDFMFGFEDVYVNAGLLLSVLERTMEPPFHHYLLIKNNASPIGIFNDSNELMAVVMPMKSNSNEIVNLILE